jgi:hypothetical protein
VPVSLRIKEWTVMRTSIAACLTIAVIGAGARPVAAQVKVVVPCDVLTKAPDRYVGQTVSFYGSMSGSDTKSVDGERQTFGAWVCKTREGDVVAGGVFGFVREQAAWTPIAARAKTMEELFRISGVVTGTDVVGGKAIPFLTRVHVEAASEVRR